MKFSRSTTKRTLCSILKEIDKYSHFQLCHFLFCVFGITLTSWNLDITAVDELDPIFLYFYALMINMPVLFLG